MRMILMTILRFILMTVINVLIFAVLLVTLLWMLRIVELEFYSSGGMELSVMFSVFIAVPFSLIIVILKQKVNPRVLRGIIIPASPFLFYLSCGGAYYTSINNRFVLISIVFFLSVVTMEFLTRKNQLAGRNKV